MLRRAWIVVLAMLAPSLAQAQTVQHVPGTRPLPAPPAPPPPPRPSPPPMARQQGPTPIGSPSSWFTIADYPALSTFAEEAGTVRFLLTIDATGAVVDCVVTESSGYDNLDTATCTLLRVRARFNPARDSAGRPIRSTYSSRFHWRLPEPPLMARTSWQIALQFTLDATGHVTQCREIGYGIEITDEENSCALLRFTPPNALIPLRGSATGPVTITVQTEHAINGTPLPPIPALPMMRFKQVEVIRITFDITESGQPENCAGDIRLYADCADFYPYVAGPERRSVSKRITIMTTGDPAVTEAAELFFR